MANRPRFTLPAGLKLEVTPEGLHIEFGGDVVIDQDLGHGLHTVVAGGDLTVDLPLVSGNLRSGGTLTVRGTLQGGYIHGREVVLECEQVQCIAISADASIRIGPTKLTADAVIAPELHVDPTTSGRVTVMESLNERGATKIKGGFSVSDYDDMFGNADAFLAQRGLQRLGGGSATPAPTRSATPPAPAPLRQPLSDELEEPTGPRVNPAPLAQEPAPLVPAAATSDEEEDDPLSLSLDQLEPLLDQPDDPESADTIVDADPALYQRLSEALQRIVACYEGTDLPPAVNELRHLVEQRDYEALRANITEVWNGLLGFHQKRKIRPHHHVTHAFNVIHALVQSQP